MARETILLVDDELTTIALHRRLLKPLTVRASDEATSPVAIATARSGKEAEAYLTDHPETAVVISDLRMPEMDGLALLERVRIVAPNAVRLLLTGNADVHAAIEAINRASIFRLLTKPSSGPALCQAVTDALKQHRLVVAERELLEKTLRGSVQVLVEMLTLIDPVGSSKALRIHRYVTHVIKKLALEDTWALEVASMLSHLGSLTLSTERPPTASSPSETSDESPSHEPGHPSVGSELLEHIPRLEPVAGIIAGQQDPIDPGDAAVALSDRDPILRGRHVLRVAIEFDAAIAGGVSREVVLLRLRQRPADFEPTVVDALGDVEQPEQTFESRSESVADLKVGMILDEDLRNAGGLLIIPRGQQLTHPALLRLRSFGSPDDLRRCVRVLAPKADLPGLA